MRVYKGGDLDILLNAQDAEKLIQRKILVQHYTRQFPFELTLRLNPNQERNLEVIQHNIKQLKFPFNEGRNYFEGHEDQPKILAATGWDLKLKEEEFLKWIKKVNKNSRSESCPFYARGSLQFRDCTIDRIHINYFQV